MAIILKHEKTLQIQRQTMHPSGPNSINQIQKRKKYVQNMKNEDKFNTLLTEENGRKTPFNTSEVKYREV